MKVSTKGRYGLIVLMDIALNQGEGAVPLRSMAKRQGISEKYLWQVVSPLKSAGILRATRGARGGYVLARPPEAISLLDVQNVLEGPVLLAPPVARGGGTGEARVAREAWAELESAMNESMRSITLGALVRRYHEQQRAGGLHYEI